MARPRGDRSRVILLAILFGLLALWARAFQLTVVQHAEHRRRAIAQQTALQEIPSLRGPILDRAGEPLAFSVEGSSLAVDPTFLSAGGSDSLATFMDRLGVMPAARVRAQLDAGSGRRFVWLTHNCFREAFACSLEKRFPLALIRKPEPKRLYPLGPAAAPLLGAAGFEGQGLFGLEGRYEKVLHGRNGRMLDFLSGSSKLHGGPGRVIIQEPRPGATVELTIDARLQQIVDARLCEAAQEQNARGGTAILCDPRTGEILALSSYPSFEPERVDDADSLALRVWAVAHNYEPGSTYKVVAFSAAMESGTVTPNDLIDCHNGSRSVPGGKPIKDHEPCGVIPVWEVLARSSNIGTGIIAERVGGEGYYRMERLLGFGVPTGVEIPGEERGRIPDPSLWSSRSLVTQAFGQEVSCTALQLAMAYGAIANGGLLMRPYLVRSIRDEDGTVLESHEPEIVRRAMRPETARTLREMFRRVVTEGTGTKAEVEGLFPAGKTGTAQKFIRELGVYSTERYVASFVGFAPYDAPRWLCIVVLDEPRGSIWGGSVAAPVFARILSDVSKLDRRPTEDTRSPIRWASQEGEMSPIVPRLVGLPSGLARNRVKQAGLFPRLVGGGDLVMRSVPEAGRRCRAGDVVSLILSQSSDSASQRGSIPDLSDFPLRDVVANARWEGVELDVRGAGWVVAQDPPPGTPIDRVRRLTVWLSPDSCRAFVRLRREGL